MEYKLKNFEAMLAEMLRLQQKWYSATDPKNKKTDRCHIERSAALLRISLLFLEDKSEMILSW